MLNSSCGTRVLTILHTIGMNGGVYYRPSRGVRTTALAAKGPRQHGMNRRRLSFSRGCTNFKQITSCAAPAVNGREFVGLDKKKPSGLVVEWVTIAHSVHYAQRSWARNKDNDIRRRLGLAVKTPFSLGSNSAGKSSCLINTRSWVRVPPSLPIVAGWSSR